LKRVSYRSTSILDIKAEDKLAAIYYLLLQDRISEALFIAESISESADELAECTKCFPLTFDYLRAYLSMYADPTDGDADKAIEGTIEIARDIATKYGGKELPKSKRKLFEDIEALLSDLNDYRREREEEGDDEERKESVIRHDHADRDRKMKELASSTPSLSFEIVDRKCVISSHLLSKCTVNFYTMNTEVLFSFSPFLNDSKSGGEKNVFSYIAPNESLQVTLDGDDEDDNVTVDIPQSLQNENLFVEVVSETLTESAPFYDHQLVVEMKANYGTLTVLKKETETKQKARWVKRAYVKVYSKNRDGSIQFYKDGYTDLRGNFDYASISTNQLEKATKFAILIAHPVHGCLVKEASVPKQ